MEPAAAWGDVFDISPWAGGARERADDPHEPLAGRRTVAAPTSDEVPGDGARYTNPWIEAAAESQPAPRRRPRRQAMSREPDHACNPWNLSPPDGDAPSGGAEAAAARAPGKNTTQEKASSDLDARPKQEAQPGAIPVENLFAGMANLLGDGLARVIDCNAFPFSSWRRPAKRKPDDRAQEIPVEPLGNGVVGALGDGLAVVIDTSLSAASRTRARAKRTLLGGLVSFCGTVGELTSRGFRKKADTNGVS